MRRPAAFLTLLLLPSLLFAWGEKGHAIANEAATHAVPTELPTFFHRAYFDLAWLGYEPDRWRGAGASADAAKAPDHFLDWEYVSHLELPRGRWDYVDLLHASGTLRRYGIGSDTPGFAPWRIAETSEILTREWRMWRREPEGAHKSRIEQNIIGLAGILGHYVADASNPHHATIHYNGWVGDPARGFRNDCQTHARFESVFVANHVDLGDVVPRMREPELREDYFATGVALIRESNGMLERLYELDRDGAFDAPPAIEGGTEFAAERLAIGASVLRDLWWSTWIASGRAERGGR